MADKDNVFEVEGIVDFLGTLESMNEDLAKDVNLWLEALGMQFLEEVHNEIIRLEVVDTRRLLNSFTKGGEGGVWDFDQKRGVLTLLIGTNVEYASWVNSGHWTTQEGVSQRWVPGLWKGDKFIYDPKAKTGMLLKRKWVEGRKFFDSAFAIFEKMFEVSLEHKLQEWMDRAAKTGGKTT